MDRPPPKGRPNCEQTDKCKNITLPHTSFAGGNNAILNCVSWEYAKRVLLSHTVLWLFRITVKVNLTADLIDRRISFTIGNDMQVTFFENSLHHSKIHNI